MRRHAAPLATALATALAMALLVLAAPPASAGGPTSVLVVNYEGSRAAGALTGSAAYANLEKALDPYTPPTGAKTSPASFMGTQIRLTWMIHDVNPWRIDAVVLDGNDVWVETAMDSGSGAGLFDVPSVRHRPRDRALLLSTLRALGVLGDQPADAARPEASAPQAAPADTGSAAPTTGEAAGAPATAGIPWWGTSAAAALALGLGLVLGRRVRPRRTPGPIAGHADAHGSPNGHDTNGHGGTNGHGTGDDSERVAPVGFTTDPDHLRH